MWKKDSEQTIRRRGNLNGGGKLSQHDEYKRDIRKKCVFLSTIELKGFFFFK